MAMYYCLVHVAWKIVKANKPKLMSWQDYVDQNLMASGCMQSAGIFGLDGNPWALSPGFAPEQSSICQLARILRSSETYSDGIKLAGNDYMVFNVDEEEGTCVLLRKKLPPNADESQKTAAIVAVSNQAVILGIYLGGHANSGTTKKFVCNLQSYLKSVLKMAQWESYSNKMVADGNLLFAGVFDHKGNAWAKSGEGCGTGATPSEVSSLVSVIRDKAHLDDGVKIGGIDFMVANVFEFEDTCVIKRKNLPENSQEKDKLDVVVALTAMTCLVGISAGGQGKGGKLKKIVCDTQNYLLQSNY